MRISDSVRGKMEHMIYECMSRGFGNVAALSAAMKEAERHGWRLMPVKATKEILEIEGWMCENGAWDTMAETVEPWS